MKKNIYRKDWNRYLYRGTIVILIAISIVVTNCCAIVKANNKESSYGVFLSSDISDYKKMIKYHEIVIDGEYFSEKDIKKLHNGGCQKIYSYLNIGSIESFRDYYKQYKKYALGDYDNWPEEKWVDVRAGDWQKQIQKNAEILKDKGIDGFFIDNVDVYYIYQKDTIYQSIVKILTKLKEYEKPIIINGGDVFVSRYLKENSRKRIFDAVNQESVYTIYNFDNGTSKKRKVSDRTYFVKYLKKVQKKGYGIYVIEYTSDSNMRKEVKDFFKNTQWKFYISKSINL